jgi:myo-inositol-1(or 4)-monophosphatase
MSLLKLAARVCKTFGASDDPLLRTVQKVKGGQARDVVTGLDFKLHELSQQFVNEYMLGCTLLSEEGSCEMATAAELLAGDWLVVDPLDGSNNHALDLPSFGFMAAHLMSGRIAGAVVVLPEFSQYMVFEKESTITSQSFENTHEIKSAAVYYAYPPAQDAKALSARVDIQNLIDVTSGGMYRYGSACVGLYQLLCGKHMGFVGHGLRMWDALAFLPILAQRGIEVHYLIHETSITLVAAKRLDFVKGVADILLHHQNLKLHPYRSNAALRIEAI